jgi:phosphonate transport system substrate-binding protein
MKKVLVLFVAIAIAVVAMTGCSSSKAESEATEYVLASLPNDGGEISDITKLVLEEMNKALEPFNATVKYVACDDYSVVSESILSGTAHIGTPSGATFTKAHLENNNIIPLFVQAVNGDLEDPATGYPAYIGTHIDNAADFEGLSDEEALQSLKGKTFSFVSATSTSGRLIPTQTLWDTFGPNGTGDVDSRNQIFELTTDEGGLFEEVQFGGNHPGSVELIVNKKVYAGAFCCEYDEGHEDEIYVIAQRQVPPGPYWVNTEYMPQEHIDALVDHFTSLTPETAVEGLFTSTPEANTDDGTLGANDRYVAVDHTFYNFLKEMYAGE